MQFSFEVDPDLDLAIGMEADIQEQAEAEAEVEGFETAALTPTESKPGSADKVRMLSARYAAGVPLWHGSDCYDHGPGTLGDEEEEAFETLSLNAGL